MATGFAFSNVAQSQTDSLLVTGSANRQILVLALAFDCVGAPTTITFNSKGSGAGTAISATWSMSQNSGLIFPYSDEGWFITNGGESLTCTTSAGSTVGIQVVYQLFLVPGVVL